MVATNSKKKTKEESAIVPEENSSLSTALDFFKNGVGDDVQIIESQKTSTSVPHAQIINPNASQAIKSWGMAIVESSANAIGFEPDDSWELMDHYFEGAEAPTKVYISKNPRLIVVNYGEDTKAEVLWDKTEQKFVPFHKNFNYQEYIQYRYYLCFLVGKDGKFLSKLPIRLSVSRTRVTNFKNALAAFYNKYNSFVRDAFESATGFDIPDNTWNAISSTAVFAPKFERKMVGKNVKSPASHIPIDVQPISDAFTLPETKEDLVGAFLQPGSDEYQIIATALTDYADWLDVIPKEFEATLEEDDSDFVTDVDASHIIPNANKGSDYVNMTAQATDEKIPF